MMQTGADRKLLHEIRDRVLSLCATQDDLLKPQYEHLLGRVDALLEITELDGGRADRE